jgi:hypothetical protein
MAEQWRTSASAPGNLFYATQESACVNVNLNPYLAEVSRNYELDFKGHCKW